MIARTTMYVAVLVLLSASATACSDPAAGRSVTRDSSGVMVVESFAEGDARPPFARESFVDLRGEMVIVGDADVLGYREYSTDGMLRRVVAVPTFQLQVSRSERDSVRKELASRPSRPQFGYLLDQMAASLPSMKPAYSQLVVDSLGHVWLSEYRSGESQVDRSWNVFAPDGTWLGSLGLPGRFQPYQIGADYLLGLSRDELDVETVQVLRLNRCTNVSRNGPCN